MMHAYVYAMQMQCNYGAKHLKCYSICDKLTIVEIANMRAMCYCARLLQQTFFYFKF
jgi:hypothetical protein